MTEIILDTITPFAEYDSKIYSYKISCILNNGRRITIIDEVPFDLTNQKNKKIKALLASYSFEINAINYDSIFLGEIKFDNILGKYIFKNDEIEVLLINDFVVPKSISVNQRIHCCFDEIILKEINSKTT